jgi:hypothetical protein
MAKRAFLIGANYTATPAVQLQGCINDIVNVRNMLIDAYGYQDSNIYVLRDDDGRRLPTKANILAGLVGIIAMSRPNDTVWVHYSGHGSQIRDLNGDEKDGLDECIVPCDYNVVGFITDDELFAILKNAKCRMILCFDSCNSGTVCDFQYSVNYNRGGLVPTVNNSRFVSNANIFILSGCRDTQTSADAYSMMAKQACGAFTTALIETLRSNSHNVPLLKLYADTCAYLQRAGFTQIPALSSSAPNPSAFSFARVLPTALVAPSAPVAGPTAKTSSRAPGMKTLMSSLMK